MDTVINTRMPVWTALSGLFLDTVLAEADFDRIAEILAASPYSEAKLEEILRFEVTPACKWNLFAPAGAWLAFDEDWIRETMAPRLDKRPFFRFGILRAIRPDWESVRLKIITLRAK